VNYQNASMALRTVVVVSVAAAAATAAAAVWYKQNLDRKLKVEDSDDADETNKD
jgi:hypothetical protein